jgi:hypothetical protein
MGYDAYAVAVIGVRHDPGEIKSVLYHESRVRGCDHELSQVTAFCATCGKPAYVAVREPLHCYDEDAETLWGYKLINRGEGYYDDPEFIAYWSSGLIRPRNIRSKNLWSVDLAKAAEEMKVKLGPLVLWNSSFGLHVFLHESC